MRHPILARLGLVAAGLLLGVLLLEGSLHVLGSAASRIGPTVLGSGRDLVLCVGDSHAWGAGKGVPRRLAERLGARGDIQVVNLGVPGSNTAQLRDNFQSYLDRFAPRLVVIWAGLNNQWNRAQTERWTQEGIVEDRSTFESIVDNIKLVKFWRVWQAQAAMRATLDDGQTYVKPTTTTGPNMGRDLRRLDVGGAEFVFRIEADAEKGPLSPAEIKRVTEMDIRALVEEAGARDIPTVVIAYPLLTPANAAIRSAAEGTQTPLILPFQAHKRILDRAKAANEKPPKLYSRDMHPTQVVYEEVGDMIVELIDEREWVGHAGSGS